MRPSYIVLNTEELHTCDSTCTVQQHLRLTYVAEDL